MTQEGIALIGVWVSLGSLDAIRDHVRANLQTELKLDTVKEEVSSSSEGNGTASGSEMLAV